jgi:hypothetical protein
MALYQNRVGVVSQSIGNILSRANDRVPHSAPVASAFLDKGEGFVQPFQVKNNTYYSKPRPTGGFDQPKKYNYVPLNVHPEDLVNQMNAPLYYPPKLDNSGVSNKFMPNSKMRSEECSPHQMALTLEQMVRVH